MSEPKRSHFIRIEFPPDATPEEVEGLEQAVLALVLTHEEANDYDINVSGSAWYPPEDDERTEPIPVALRKLHGLIQDTNVDNSPIDATMFHNALQELANLGMSKVDLQIHLSCAQAVNDVVRRNLQVENNLLTAMDMVTGHVGNPEFRITYQAGTP